MIFRKLSAENRRLYTDVEKEAQEKKRLSMENEELHWKMRQSLDHSGLMSMSVIEGKTTQLREIDLIQEDRLCKLSLRPFLCDYHRTISFVYVHLSDIKML